MSRDTQRISCKDLPLITTPCYTAEEFEKEQKKYYDVWKEIQLERVLNNE